MVATLYQYSSTADFSGVVNKKKLKIDIDVQLAGLVAITVQGDNVNFVFDPALSAGDQTVLDGIVSSTTVNDIIPVISDITIDSGIEDRDIIIYDAAIGAWRNKNFDEVSVQKAVDRQCVTSTIEVATTSKSYLDLNAMTLTANNLGTGNYMMILDLETEEENKKEWRIIISIDDVNDSTTERIIKGLNDIQHRNFIFKVSGVAHGSVIKVKWLTSTKTVTSYKRTFGIIEIP